jgi:hypothetical protein
MITMGIGSVGDLNTKTDIEKDIVESRTCRKKNSRLLKEHPKPRSSRSLLLCRYIDDNVWKYPSSVMTVLLPFWEKGLSFMD